MAWNKKNSSKPFSSGFSGDAESWESTPGSGSSESWERIPESGSSWQEEAGSSPREGGDSSWGDGGGERKRSGPGGKKTGKRRGRKGAAEAPEDWRIRSARFNLPLFLQSLIVGTLTGAGARYLYEKLVDIYSSRILVILLVMGGFYLAYALIMYLIQLLKRELASPGIAFLALLACTAGITGCSALFEWIYELGNPAAQAGPTSYIFVIDDSGSMESSDEHFTRYAAIASIMQDQSADFPYAVYSFNNDLLCLRELAVREERIPDLRNAKRVGGGTEIRTILGELLGKLEGDALLGPSPKVLLLSDGAATDIDLLHSVTPVLKDYYNKGISISTVGLGAGADRELLTRIAEGTGGVYVDVQNLGDLTGAMQSAIESTAQRDLLCVRYMPSMNRLLAVERTIFMAILGCLAGLSMIVVLGQAYYRLQLFAAPAKGLLAGLLLELLINTVYANENVADLVYFVLIALVFFLHLPAGIFSGGFSVGGDRVDTNSSERERTGGSFS